MPCASWFLPSVLLDAIQDLSLSDNDSVPFGTCIQGQLLIDVSSVFPQSGFRLHSDFAEIFGQTEVVFIAVLHSVVVQKALVRNSPVC